MVAERMETLKKLVNVNDTFRNRANCGNIQEIGLYLKFEMALLFFKLNKNDVFSLDSEDKNLVLFLINDEYVLDEDYVVVNGLKYEIEYVLLLIGKMKEDSQVICSDKIIQVDFGNKREKNNITSKVNTDSNRGTSDILDIRSLLKDRTFTYEEREYIFERSLCIDSYTLPFINISREFFVSKMNKIIKRIMDGKSVNIDDTYFQLLVSYLSMYPFVEYGKEYVSLENLNIPQNEIGIAKCVIKDEFLSSLEDYEQSLRKERKEYLEQVLEFSKYTGKVVRVAEIAETKVREIDIKLQECSYKYFIYVHDEKVYNPNVLSYLVEAFKQGNVYIKEDGSINPIVRFFVIDSEVVSFFGAMRLNVFKNLIVSSEIMPFDKGIKILKKKKDKK